MNLPNHENFDKEKGELPRLKCLKSSLFLELFDS